MRDWDNIRIFLGVCRYGSLAAAARALKVDETTVGRPREGAGSLTGHIAVRSHRAGFDSNGGRRGSARRCRGGRGGCAQCAGYVVGSDTRPSGFVRITATETLSSQFLVPALGAFHLRYPEIRLELFSGYIALDVARGEADIAVRALPPVGSHLVARRLGAVALAVYAAPEYLAQNPVGRFEDGLAGHDLIGFSDLMSPRPPGDPFLGASTAGGQLVFTGNSPLGLTEAAEAGLGVATLPCYLAACRPGLTRIWPDRSQRYDLLAVMRQEVKRSARIRAVVDYLARHFRTQQSLLEGS
jgi:DNA-binding transcriptional LysR family regulator